MQCGLYASLDLPGLITATCIYPLKDVCRYVEFTGGVIPKNPGSVITLSVIEKPIDPKVDRDYMVWLADLDGVTLNAENISWSAGAGRVKSVALKFPQFDSTVSKLIDYYNYVFLARLKNTRMRPSLNVRCASTPKEL